MLVAALAAGTVGLAACGGDDGDDASSAVASAQSQAASIQSQVGEQVDSALSQGSEQVESAMSQVQSGLEEATSAAGSVASEATTEDTGGGESSAAGGESSAAAGAGDATAGKAVFMSAGCVGCHTLADAGATGTVGPNLDEAKPPFDLVVERVTNGKGAMPSFAGQLSDADIQNVAAYVSSVAGQ
jgi:sulfite dehydrogenase